MRSSLTVGVWGGDKHTDTTGPAQGRGPFRLPWLWVAFHWTTARRRTRSSLVRVDFHLSNDLLTDSILYRV